jgi:transcriptional regulator GlxA family with amidase domain
MQRKKVGIVIFDDVEVLDFCGPFEVFSVARLDDAKRREESSPFEVLLVAQKSEPVTTSGGMRVLADVTFANCPALDILVVPGGWGTRSEMNNVSLLSFIRDHASSVETLVSVCTGSLLLGKAGLLDGLRATTHWLALDLMAELFPNVNVDRTSHVVEQDKVITSAGISAGIDLALRVVARYYGEPVARATAQYMEYPYPESNARRVAVSSA